MTNRDGVPVDEATVLSAYWAEHLVDGGLCAICRNQGRFTSAVTGREMYCVCPNGRGWRERPSPPLYTWPSIDQPTYAQLALDPTDGGGLTVAATYGLRLREPHTVRVDLDRAQARRLADLAATVGDVLGATGRVDGTDGGYVSFLVQLLRTTGPAAPAVAVLVADAARYNYMIYVRPPEWEAVTAVLADVAAQP